MNDALEKLKARLSKLGHVVQEIESGISVKLAMGAKVRIYHDGEAFSIKSKGVINTPWIYLLYAFLVYAGVKWNYGGEADSEHFFYWTLFYVGLSAASICSFVAKENFITRLHLQFRDIEDFTKETPENTQ